MERPTDGWLADLWHRHRGKLVGSACGLAFALVVMAAGIFWTLFITVCVVVGYSIGKRLDEDYEDLGDFVQRLMSHGSKFR